MTVSDFDSNGLIFALSESASTEGGEMYRLAVRNIMDAQGLTSCRWLTVSENEQMATT